MKMIMIFWLISALMTIIIEPVKLFLSFWAYFKAQILRAISMKFQVFLISDFEYAVAWSWKLFNVHTINKWATLSSVFDQFSTFKVNSLWPERQWSIFFKLLGVAKLQYAIRYPKSEPNKVGTSVFDLFKISTSMHGIFN